MTLRLVVVVGLAVLSTKALAEPMIVKVPQLLQKEKALSEEAIPTVQSMRQVVSYLNSIQNVIFDQSNTVDQRKLVVRQFMNMATPIGWDSEIEEINDSERYLILWVRPPAGNPLHLRAGF